VLKDEYARVSVSLRNLLIAAGLLICSTLVFEKISQLPQVIWHLRVIDSRSPTQSKYLQAELSRKYGFIDSKGDWKIAPTFNFARPFSEGLAAVNHGDWRASLNDYIDKTGEISIKTEQSSVLGKFSGGQARIIDGEGASHEINARGQTTRKFDERFKLLKNDSSAISRSPIPYQDQQKWGYLNPDGKILVVAQFDTADSFKDGLGVFSSGGHWAGGGCKKEHGAIYCYASRIAGSSKGATDSNGKIVLQPIYEDLDNLSKSAVFFKRGNRWGTMDLSGKILLEPTFDSVNTTFDMANEEPFPIVINYLQDVIDLYRDSTSPQKPKPFRVEPSEGYAIARNKFGVRFISVDGHSAPSEFADALPFSEGLAAVAEDANGKKKLWFHRQNFCHQNTDDFRQCKIVSQRLRHR
jgi:hypothetical protein